MTTEARRAELQAIANHWQNDDSESGETLAALLLRLDAEAEARGVAAGRSAERKRCEKIIRECRGEGETDLRSIVARIEYYDDDGNDPDRAEAKKGGGT